MGEDSWVDIGSARRGLVAALKMVMPNLILISIIKSLRM